MGNGPCHPLLPPWPSGFHLGAQPRTNGRHANERENQRYLPGFPLPDNLTAHTELTEALDGSELVLMVTSVAGLRDSVELIKQAGYGHLPILTACKGFELDTGLLTFQVVREILPDNDKIGVLSGPSFAQELAKQLPCAVVLASENEKWINGLVQELNTPVMRLYANTDIIGAAVGGAVKTSWPSPPAFQTASNTA